LWRKRKTLRVRNNRTLRVTARQLQRAQFVKALGAPPFDSKRGFGPGNRGDDIVHTLKAYLARITAR
jgi:hypothetical protein